MFRDRLLRGFWAGLVGGIVMNLYSVVLLALNWTEMPFYKWAAIIILGKANVGGTMAVILGTAGHLIFTALLGIGFSYLIPHLKNRYLLFKGWVYAVGVWFVIYGFSTLYKVQGTIPILPKTAIANFFGAGIYGLVTAYVIGRLEAKAIVKE